MSRHPPPPRLIAAEKKRATELPSWHDGNAFAVFVRHAPVPKTLNGTELRAWSLAPSDTRGWNALAADAELPELEFSGPPGLVPAAGVVIVEPDGRVWLHSPVAATAGPFSALPASICRQGETMQAAALRAAFDATGLQVVLERVLGDFARTRAHTRYYIARRIDGTPARHGRATESVSLVPFSQLAAALPGEVHTRILHALIQPPLLRAGKMPW